LWQRGHTIRSLVIFILLHCHPTYPLKLWNDLCQHLSDDRCHLLQTKYEVNDPSDNKVQSLALSLIRCSFQKSNSDLDIYHLPQPQHEFVPQSSLTEHLIRDQYSYNINVLRETGLRDSARLNVDQCAASDNIMISN
jgi:hypothetical protein